MKEDAKEKPFNFEEEGIDIASFPQSEKCSILFSLIG